VPCVFFDSSVPGAGDGTVLLDNATGIDLLVDHVIGHGHQRLGLLAGSISETSGHERLAAFRGALERHGLDPGSAHVGGERWTREDGHRATREMLTAAAPPTAIVASSVELALGGISAARELGLRIPEDVALATFDDAYFAELLDPPLTAVAYDPSEVGRRAAALLVEAMADGEPTQADVRIPVELVTRRSCGCRE
jgi:DNA-binding LacI/PurR family transcriptional regulator